MTNNNLHLIIGLGNPGEKYKEHRHNIGFMLIDKLKEFYGETESEEKFGGELTVIPVGDNKLFLFKPMKYMNNSGIPARECKSFYKIPLENCVVIHDDLDLGFLRLKTKVGGGAGGHNGLKSMDSNVGKNYARIRFGIGRPENKSQVHSYVLSNFTAEEQKKIEQYSKEFVQNFHLIIEKNYDKFMNNITMRKTDGI